MYHVPLNVDSDTVFFFLGYNPLFNESFEFQINLPELALVRFAVLDDEFIGDEFIGQYTLPFECMQTGKPIKCPQ